MIDGLYKKTLWFHIYSDYRSGPEIYVYNKPPLEEDDDVIPSEEEDDVTPCEACEITFDLPTYGYRAYIVNEYPTYKPIWHKDLKDDEDFETIYLKLFSQIHDCMPFKVSGYNCAYKEEGEYPDVPEDIIILNEIEETITNNIKNCIEEYYFFCVLDNEGDEIFTKLLKPIC